MLNPANLVPAQVVRVHSVTQIDVQLDLGFGVFKRHLFALEDIRVSDIPPALRRDAAHCLVVLIGGKSVLLQPDTRKVSAKLARVYLTDRIHGSPVGLAMHAPGFDRPVLDVTTYYQWLRGCDFDLDEVRSVLKGKKESA